jgi:phenylalanyl-tRNA synthetase alpha chain
MEKFSPPIKAIIPGKCYRNEDIDASHENTFYQLEGIVIDKGISVANLMFTMETMLSRAFERKITVRLRPGYFPFVEPGFELDIKCEICGGKGCPTCKNSGWVELVPCGMVHPNVLKYGGIDSEVYTGFAFGLGLTRFAMMKYGIPDIRIFNSGNLKIMKQFK